MKYILKLSFVLLSLVILSCSTLVDFNEKEYVVIHVGFDTDKLSYTGEFKQNAGEGNYPTMVLPYYNASGQTITVGSYAGFFPDGLSIDGEYVLPTIEQGTLEMPITGNTSTLGVDTLVFYVKTATRTWDITYPVVFTSASDEQGELQITNATFDAKAMRGVQLRNNDTTGNKQINLSYINGYGKRVTISLADPSGTDQLLLSADISDKFLANSAAENTLTVPISGKYLGSEEYIDLTIIATEYVEIGGTEEAEVSEFPIRNILTVQPATFSFDASFFSSREADTLSGTDRYYYYPDEDVNDASVKVSYTNGEYRDVTLTAKFREPEKNPGLYFNNDPTLTEYTANYSLTATTGEYYIPISGYASSVGVAYIDVYIEGYGGDNAISTLSAATPETCEFIIYQNLD